MINKITIDFERVPTRAIHRVELEPQSGDIYTAAAQAGAMLQLQEKMRVRILDVGFTRETTAQPAPVASDGPDLLSAAKTALAYLLEHPPKGNIRDSSHFSAINEHANSVCSPLRGAIERAEEARRKAQTKPLPSPATLEDAEALDLIAERMDGKDWDADACDQIASIVRRTSRTINEVIT